MIHALAPAAAPAHVAMIMDGNRRWAKAHGLPVAEGYRRGVLSLRAAVRAAIDNGVGRLTVYGFSTENWRRDPNEVDIVMQLCAASGRTEKAGLLRQGVRVEVIGDLDAFVLPARAAVRDLVRTTAHNRRLTLTLALNYSGRTEILRAARSLAMDVACGKLRAADVGDASLRERLYAPNAPDPDLLIRTGGDFRISNFLLYQLAYTELLTVPILWPDFDETHFERALDAYAERQRRYGS